MVKIPVLFWSMKIEGQVAMRKGLEEEISSHNAKQSQKIELIPFVAGEGRDGVQKQISQFSEALRMNPAAIVIQPTDNSALSVSLQNANRQKVPVIAYDQYIVNGTMASYVTSDNYAAGFESGNYVLSLYGRSHELRIVVFEYPRVSSTTERVDGFFDALRGQGQKFRVVRRYEAVDPDSGAKAANSFLKDFPRKGTVDLILTVNDGGGLSIVKRLLEKKRTELRHITFDGDPQSVENLKQQRLTIINSAQFCAELGREAARSLIRLLQKKTVAERKTVSTYPITQSTVASYPGWMGVPQAKSYQTGMPGRIFKEFSFSGIEKKLNKSLVRIKIGVAPLCPYFCEKSPGVWYGYLYDVVSEVAKKHGLAVEWEKIPNSRLVNALRSRKVNYVIVPRYMVRYLQDVRVVGPHLGLSYTGALLPSEVKDSLIDEEYIQGKRVVTADIIGDEDGGSLKLSILNSRKISGADVFERIVAMMREQRADMALADFNVLRYYMMRSPQSRLRMVPTSLTGFNSLVLVGAPREPEFGFLPTYLENWLDQARKEGSLEQILSKYNINDWSML